MLAIAEVAACLHVPHIAPYCPPRGPFCIQSLLQQPFHFTAHMPIQLFFKERFPLFPLQLKMTSVEDFQFSHQGVPPSWSLKRGDRKSTRLNSSHGYISYAVFCLKKKKNQ